MDLRADLAWGVLDREERTVVGSLVEELGFRVEDWPHLPPIRDLVYLLAVFRMAGEIERDERVSPTDARRLAVEELGHDDPDRDSIYHAADAIGRRLSDWHSRVRTAGENLRPSSDDSA